MTGEVGDADGTLKDRKPLLVELDEDVINVVDETVILAVLVSLDD